jgi:hypothetical protein
MVFMGLKAVSGLFLYAVLTTPASADTLMHRRPASLGNIN